MGRGVEMRFSDPGAGGFGIKKRSWFGAGGGGRRPAFMEGLPPPYGGSYARLTSGVVSEGVPPPYGGILFGKSRTMRAKRRNVVL